MTKSESKSRVLVFVDEANICLSASRSYNKSIDWQLFRDYLAGYGDSPRELVEMVVYAGLPPATSEWIERRHAKRSYLQHLKSMGLMVFEKTGQPRGNGSYKANVDVVMAIDAMDLTQRIRPDIVVLVTGDADFAHLALTIRRQGIRVEVAALPHTLSGELRASANGLIDLTDLVMGLEDYRPSSLLDAADPADPNPKDAKGAADFQTEADDIDYEIFNLNEPALPPQFKRKHPRNGGAAHMARN